MSLALPDKVAGALVCSKILLKTSLALEISLFFTCKKPVNSKAENFQGLLTVNLSIFFNRFCAESLLLCYNKNEWRLW